MKQKTLLDLKINQIGIIKKIIAPVFIKERLHKLGIIQGTNIKFIRKTPLASPRIYEYLHTQIALRNSLARKIKICIKKK